MELTKESESLLDKIRPPRLEDAGLEDCALPPESIKEAFLKAATAVRSMISASDDEDESQGQCLKTPSPSEDSTKDALVVITEGIGDIPGKCTTEKGGGGEVPEGTSDVVAVEGAKDAEDGGDLVGGSSLPEGGQSCVDGLQGLEIGDKGGEIKKKEAKEEDEESRDGYIREAFELARKMPLEPNVKIWGSLLGACRMHKAVELADDVLNLLVKLEPKNAGKLSALSNIYASAGDWDNVANIRLMMKSIGRPKQSGASLLLLHDEYREFTVMDKSHVKSDKIYQMVDRLGQHLKLLSPVPVGLCNE